MNSYRVSSNTRFQPTRFLCAKRPFRGRLNLNLAKACSLRKVLKSLILPGLWQYALPVQLSVRSAKQQTQRVERRRAVIWLDLLQMRRFWPKSQKNLHPKIITFNLYYSQNTLRVGATTLIFYMLQLVILSNVAFEKLVYPAVTQSTLFIVLVEINHFFSALTASLRE